MTETGRWLHRARRRLLVRIVMGGATLTVGAVLVALALGLFLGNVGAYRHAPWAALIVWLAPLAIVIGGAARVVQQCRELTPLSMARAVEREGQRRRGSVGGAATWSGECGSASLAAFADRQVLAWLDREGERSLAAPRRRVARGITVGTFALAVGAIGLVAAGPGGEGARFWHPLSLLAAARGPVLLDVDRVTVQRGDSVTVTVTARGRAAATLWIRAPGDPWDERPLALDTAGSAGVVLGPLDSDRFLRAVSGGRSSETVRVRVALPALITGLELSARFPGYLERPDEMLASDAGDVLLPVGTVVRTRGQATVPLASAAWRSGDRTVTLDTDATGFAGSFVVYRSGQWTLAVEPASGGQLSERPPELSIVAVPDSAPVVAIPVPGTDTTAPLSLRQTLLLDVRDDHRLSRVELVSWRVSRLGNRGEAAVEPVALPEAGTERAIVPWVLDLNERGFLPGDTAYYLARARDNAPSAQEGSSAVFRLRLPEMAELREAMRLETRSVGGTADSLVAEQEALARRIEDLAAERERSSEQAGEQLPFESAERAREVLDEQTDLAERAATLDERMRELSDAAWNAGITDPAFHEQLRQIRDLLERAITEDLVERLDALRDALEHLDASATRDAMRELASAAQQLREELARSRDLFERAAVEGELTTLSADAEELAGQQQEWNRTLEQLSDTVAEQVERDLADRGDSLAAQLEQLGARLDSAQMSSAGVSEGQKMAGTAAASMEQAAMEAGRGERSDAEESGQRASQALDPLAESLRLERDRLREEWRQEVLAEMDRALVEAAVLARAQEAINERIRRAESGPEVRGQQAAVKEGVDRVVDRLRLAAGKNALVSPQLSMALGLARERMEQALALLQQANPNTRDASEQVGESLDALNQAVYAMVRSREQVADAASGSGLAEALERMAQLAQQQGALSGQSGDLLSLMEAGGAQFMEEMQALAARQRALARELERLRAQGELSGAGELGEEAEQLARDLEGGRLDRDLVERQERLFRRLLDAGRTLESDEEDQRRERVAESARPGNVQLPEQAPVPVGAPRFRYPTWDDLRSLTPEERRLVLEYFRRLNDARP